MGQITTETIKMIRSAIDAGKHPPLTLWEVSQLAWAWERWQATLATPATAQPATLTDPQLVEHMHARGWPVALSDAPMLREAHAALDVDATALVKQPEGWISVDDRLPEHEDVVMLSGHEANDPARNRRFIVIGVFHREGTFHTVEEGDEFYPPTHWMPLPATPGVPAKSTFSNDSQEHRIAAMERADRKSGEA